MSTDMRCVFEDQDLDDAMARMADSRIRRLPVVSRDDRQRLVGIISLGDVALRSRDDMKGDVEDTVEMVSSRSGPAGDVLSMANIAGRTGEGGMGEASAGTDLSRAGENGIGAAGASGEPLEGKGNRPDAGTGDTRRNYGVGGGDLNADGLPPA